MKITRLTLLTATLCLAACAPQIRPAPQAKGAMAPLEWRTTLLRTGAVEADWWKAFGDSRLDALVTQARANNVDIGLAIARVEEAREQERVSRSLLLPTLDANVAASESRSLNAFGAASTGFAAQPVFQASYELDLFGKNRAQVTAAAANSAAMLAAKETAQLAISAATASSYITLLALDARLLVLQETLGTRGVALRIARDRARVGYTSQLELQQAQAEYEATEQQIPAIHAAIARQENALSVLVGDAPHAIPRGGTFAALRRPVVPEVLPSELTRQRPDILQAEYALAAGDARLRSARAQFLPQIRLAASTGAVISSALDDPVAIWSLGGSLLAPIFNAGRLQGQFDTATAQRDQLAYAYQRAVLIAFREVEDQLAIIKHLDEQEKALTAQRHAVSEVYRHATNRYRAGYSGYLEQIDAQRGLLSVDLALVQLRADRLTAFVALYQALGGGYQPL